MHRIITHKVLFEKVSIVLFDHSHSIIEILPQNICIPYPTQNTNEYELQYVGRIYCTVCAYLYTCVKKMKEKKTMSKRERHCPFMDITSFLGSQKGLEKKMRLCVRERASDLAREIKK